MAARPVKTKPNFLAGVQLAGVDLATTLGAKAPIANPTFTTAATAPLFAASGVLSATGGGRFLGTIAAQPSANAHLVGDFYIERTLGFIWLCTASGTPGTWVPIGASGRVIGEASSDSFATGITGVVDIAGLSIASFTVPTGLTATAEMTIPVTLSGAAAVSAVITMTNSAGTVYSDATMYVYMATNASLYPAGTMLRKFTAGTYSLKGRFASLFSVPSVGYGLTGDEGKSWLKVTID